MSELCDIKFAARDKLPHAFQDKSGMRFHIAAAFIASLNAVLAGNTRVSRKRRSLHITLHLGDEKGNGLIRRVAVSTVPVVMLDAALLEAALETWVQLTIAGSEIQFAPRFPGNTCPWHTNIRQAYLHRPDP